jgi:hypothetical protein
MPDKMTDADGHLAEWTELVRATLGPETEAILREGGASHEEIAKRLTDRGVDLKKVEAKMKGLADKYVAEHLLPGAVARPMNLPPMASPREYRAPFGANMGYEFPGGSGFSCAGNRLPPLGPNGADEVMDLATGRVAHNIVCSHTGWFSSGTLSERRASLVGVQVTIKHPTPMTYWVNATRTSTKHNASGSVPPWGSSSITEQSFLVLEVYGPNDNPGFPSASVWSGPESLFTRSNPGATTQSSFGASSVQVNVVTGPTFPVGTQVFILAGVGTRHTGAATNADMTTWTVNDWTIDKISMWP